MASARPSTFKNLATPVAPPERVFPSRKAKRHGHITEPEKAIIAQFVADQPAEISIQQVTALSKVLRRSKDTIKDLIEQARENLQVSLQDYVAIHKSATMDAASSDTMAGKKIAIEAAQWAMENVGIDGVKAVEKAKSEAYGGPRVLVGIRVGGVEQPITSIAIQESIE